MPAGQPEAFGKAKGKEDVEKGIIKKNQGKKNTLWPIHLPLSVARYDHTNASISYSTALFFYEKKRKEKKKKKETQYPLSFHLLFWVTSALLRQSEICVPCGALSCAPLLAFAHRFSLDQ